MILRYRPGRVLTEPELAALVRGLGRRIAWRPLVRFDAERRGYYQLLRTDHVDIWVLGWLKGQDTGFHDHDVSAAAIAVVEGGVVEERLAIGRPNLRHEMATGDVVSLDETCTPPDVQRVRPAGHHDSRVLAGPPSATVPTSCGTTAACAACRRPRTTSSRPSSPHSVHLGERGACSTIAAAVAHAAAGDGHPVLHEVERGGAMRVGRDHDPDAGLGREAHRGRREVEPTRVGVDLAGTCRARRTRRSAPRHRSRTAPACRAGARMDARSRRPVGGTPPRPASPSSGHGSAAGRRARSRRPSPAPTARDPGSRAWRRP